MPGLASRVGRPPPAGMGIQVIARAWTVLMRAPRGIRSSVAQGGDWGAITSPNRWACRPAAGTARHSHQHPRHCSPFEIVNAAAFSGGAGALKGYSAEEKCRLRRPPGRVTRRRSIAYGYQMGLRPSDAVRRSPIHPSDWRPISWTTTRAATELISRVFAGESAGLTRDDILDNITHFLADEHCVVRRPVSLGN